MKLISDGSLDTVFECEVCGKTVRYNYANDSIKETYEEFISWAKEDAKEWCDCNLGGDYELT